MAAPTPYEPVSEREIASGRALAAVAYLPALALIGLLEAPRNRYVQFHARQGLVLFGVEIAVWIALALFDATVGRVPVAGPVVSAMLRLGFGLAFLAVTLYGVYKGATGERIHVPLLGEAAERLMA